MSLKLCSRCGQLHPSTTRRCPTIRPRNGSTRSWRATRERILVRDGYLCQIRDPARCMTHATTVDHIVSIADGGSDDDSNLQASCAPCNLAKGDRS